ncbi:hypothetical protein ACEQPO_24475 [Bacillus sp. SL00103]
MVRRGIIMHIYYYDENFMYTGEDVIDFQEVPENATDVRPKKVYIFLNMPRTRESGLNQHRRVYREHAAETAFT